MTETSRRRRRVLGIVLAALALLALGVVLALPTILDAALTRAVDGLAGRHGIDVRWATADVRSDGLTLTDVRISAAEGQASIKEVRAAVDLWSALTGDVRVNAVDVIEPVVQLGRLDGQPSDDSPMTPDGSSMAPDGFQMASMAFDEPFRMPPALTRALSRLDGPLPVVRIERPSVAVRRGDRLYRATADTLDLTPAEAGWGLEASETELHLLDRRVVLARAEGAVGPDGLRVDARTAAGTRLVVGPATAMVERIALRVGERAAEVRVEGVDAAVGPLLAEGLTLSARWVERLELKAAHGSIRLTAWPTPPAAGVAGEASAVVESPAHLIGSLPPLEGEALSIELPGLPPLLDVSGRWHAGALAGRARVADGEVIVAAHIDPGRRRPHSLHVEFEGVRLAPLFARRPPPAPPRRPREQTRADGVLDGHLTAAVLDDIGGEALGDAVHTLVEGHLAWREGQVELAGLADTPVDGIDLTLAGRLDWQPADDRLDFAGRVAQGPLALVGEGRVDDALGDPHVLLTARGEPIDCAAAFAAVPRGLWGPYDRAELSGTLEPTFRLDWPVHRPQTLELKIRKLFKACAIGTLAAREAPPAEVDGRPAPGLDDVGWLDTRFVLPVREGVSDGAEVNVGPGVAGYVPLNQLPRYVGATMYQSEEMNFWRNNAIDRGLLMRALRIDLEAGRFVYGGSTVTQQLVKNLFLTRQKTLARKLQELLVATRITQAISRERVLELYLNCIEFGPDVYGIRPAARYYFQKDARELTPREAVFLAMLKPAPRRGAFYRRRGHPPIGGWWAGRAEELMGRLVENGQIPAATAEAERPYHIEWVDKRYVVPTRAPRPIDADPEAPDGAASPAPPPFGGSRLPIEP